MNTDESGRASASFTGHVLMVSNSLCVVRRLSDAMILLYDRDTAELQLLKDVSELVDYLDTEEYQTVQRALYNISHKILH